MNMFGRFDLDGGRLKEGLFGSWMAAFLYTSSACALHHRPRHDTGDVGADSMHA